MGNFALYLLKEEDGQVFWYGKAAVHFRLVGRPLDPIQFANVLNGLTPDGTGRLTRKHRRRQAGWEIVVTMDKSIELHRLTLTPDERLKFDKAIEFALKDTVLNLIQTNCLTRRSHGGRDREQAAPFITVVRHRLSRTGDPSPHFHVIIHNAALRNDLSTGTIVSHFLFEHQKVFHAAFQKRLDEVLSQEFGLATRRWKGLAVIKGFSRRLIREFSTRSKQIKDSIRAKGLKETPTTKQIQTFKTRPEKEYRPFGERVKNWRERIARFGQAQARRAARPAYWFSEQYQRRQASRIFRHAVKALVCEKGAFTATDLFTKAITFSIGRSPSTKVIREQLTKFFARELKRSIVEIDRPEKKTQPEGQKKSPRIFTTKKALKREALAVAAMDKLAKQPNHELNVSLLKKVMREREHVHPQMAEHLFRATRSGLPVLKEKNCVLAVSAIADAYKRRGYQVIGVAARRFDAERLSQLCCIQAHTPKSFEKQFFTGRLRSLKLARKDRGWAFRPVEFLKAAEQHYRERPRINKKTVVILFQPTNLSPDAAHRVVRRTQRRGGKIIEVFQDPNAEPTVYRSIYQAHVEQGRQKEQSKEQRRARHQEQERGVG
jgi:conjugative relaxase-like TrwC/TraI family protein